MKIAALLHESVSGLLDDPLKENKSSASYYLTMHCFMLAAFILVLLRKYSIDLFDAFQTVWPVKSTNFRNPLSVGAAMFTLIAGPLFIFWSRVGGSRSEARIGLRHYQSISFASSICVNIFLCFVAAKLDLPEVSIPLALVNFIVWARWSIRKYSALTSKSHKSADAA